MKVKIRQRCVYHKIAKIELEIDKNRYQDWIKENNYNIDDLDYYLSMNEDLWVNKIDDATEKSELQFGFGCYGDFNEYDSELETRYDCKELKIGGHL